MSSIDQSSRDGIESLFGSLKKAPFTAGNIDPLPQSRPPGDGNIQPVGYIADGAIDDIASFADSIRPPEVVAALPTLPDTDYPQGSFVFLTTDEKLYRNTDGSTWSVAVDGADIVSNSITAGAIAAGAIGTTQLAAEAITADKLAIGGVLGNLLRNGSFEQGSSFDTDVTSLPGWASSGGATLQAATSGYARTGSYVLKVVGDGSTANPAATQAIPVIAGRRYRLRGWFAKGGSSTTTEGRFIAHTLDADGSFVTFNVINKSLGTSATQDQYEDEWTAPDDGTVTALRIDLRAHGTPANGESFVFEDVVFEALPDAVRNSSAEVVIDSTGITITNGKLVFKDASGSNVLTGAGFGASWFDFIQTRFYNTAFSVPATASGELSVSEVSGGDTEDDYADSLSSLLPYWVISSKTGAGSFSHVADSTASSGKVIRWNGTITAEIYQDIPVTPGQQYAVVLNWKHNATSTHRFTVTVGSQPVDANHTPFGTVTEDALLYSGGATSDYALEGRHFSSTVPAAARYLRVYIEVARVAGTPVVSLAAVEARPVIEFGAHQIRKGSLLFDSTYGVSWSDGTTADIAIVRTSTREIAVQNPLGSSVTFTTDRVKFRDSIAATPPASSVYLRAVKNGSGKMELRIQYPGGSSAVLDTEP